MSSSTGKLSTAWSAVCRWRARGAPACLPTFFFPSYHSDHSDPILSPTPSGFYRCDSDEQLALFLAQRYYITQGYKLDEKQLRRQLKRDRVVGMESRSTSEWVDMVTRAFDSREYYANTCSAEDVQVEVVQMVRQQWYMSFSQRFTDVSVAIGKKVYDGLTLCINSEGGIAVQETRNSRGVLSKTVADMRFIHIAEISEAAESDEDEDLTVFTVTVVLPKRTKFRVTHANGGLMQSLLWSYYQGMRNRSKYCMATLPYRAPGSESSFLSCDRGDVIILPKIWAEVDDGGWANGVSERTNAKVRERGVGGWGLGAGLGVRRRLRLWKVGGRLTEPVPFFFFLPPGRLSHVQRLCAAGHGAASGRRDGRLQKVFRGAGPDER